MKKWKKKDIKNTKNYSQNNIYRINIYERGDKLEILKEYNSMLLHLYMEGFISPFSNLIPYSLYEWLLNEIEEIDSSLSEKIKNNDKKLLSIGLPDKLDNRTSSLRINVFDKDLAELILEMLKKIKIIKIKKKKLHIDLVTYGGVDRNRLDFSEDFHEMELYSKNKTIIKYEFKSGTFFKRGDENYIFPDPVYIYKNLAEKFSKFNPIDINMVIEKSKLINISEMHIKTLFTELNGSHQVGFRGKIEFDFSNIEGKYRDLLLLLASFGYYSGIGCDTNIGFGENIPTFE
ncbi:MAG: CRISPR system precrRNA processing endoribonuclease RAMP protein Cas6 [Candidatus Muirbacterium halophilum]|nr:CRISPR system precrRNA processing endoribonuclease RAMP protein Cas6 [Candidatus Muirbacterium halophilum]MCK9474333.1 CRISPR system precrRNA processing endoribonuclease RAMP protein Cas6 [Candidatus Muirbacterium halophilum]